MDFSTILSWFSRAFHYIAQWLYIAFLRVEDWVIDFATYLPKVLYSSFVDLVLYIIGLLPDSGLSSAVSYLTSISGYSGLAYFLGLAQFDIGLPLILGAYVIRFLIRRIPIIG